MVNYRKILQLDADKNVSVRDLLSSAHCSYRSYTSTIEAAKAKGIKWPLDDDVTNEELQEFLFPGKYTPLSIYRMPHPQGIGPDWRQFDASARGIHK